MKTRIISGIVLALIAAAVIISGSYFSIIITVFLAILNIIASYELLKNATVIKSKAALIVAGIYSALAVFSLSAEAERFSFDINPFTILTVIYCVISAIIILFNNSEFNSAKIFGFISMPVIVSFAFGSLEIILNNKQGIYYLLLLLNFSSVCDMGAYFVGSSMGKHKLCPSISPKKTIEGAIGGILSSLIVSVILVLSFGLSNRLLITLILTIPFCVVGMVGDLFASSIKRAAGIKDYGTLIPGHGGILDRMDSILMLSPLLYLFIIAGII